MPKDKYRIDPEGRKRLLLEWEEPFKNVVVTLDKQRLGVFPDQAAFERGRSFLLPNRSTLSLRLLHTPTRAELVILVDGKPVPRYSAYYRSRETSCLLAFVGVDKLLFIAAPQTVSSMAVLASWVGVPSVILALSYLMLAVLVYRKSLVALGLAVATAFADGLLATDGYRFLYAAMIVIGLNAMTALRAIWDERRVQGGALPRVA